MTLVGVENDQVTVDVEGNKLTMQVGTSSQAGGLNVSVQKVTKDQVVLHVTKN